MPRKKEPPKKRRKQPAEVIEFDLFATRVPARQRFRKVMDLALDYMSDRSLNFISFRVESELRFMAQYGGKTVSDLNREERQKLDELLESKVDEAAGVKPIDRKSKKKGSRST